MAGFLRAAEKRAIALGFARCARWFQRLRKAKSPRPERPVAR